MFLSVLKALFFKSDKPNDKPAIASVSDPYRVNRIVRSEWNAGNCDQLNSFHHYSVCIDGEYHRFGIVEILGAIDALEEYERLEQEQNQ